MKELTIEQKAQRYDKALEKTKLLYGLLEPMSGCNVIIETMFPELAESEGEKIRKSLIKHFREYESCTFDGLTSTEVLSWLERQGEHANFLNKIQVGDKVTKNEAGVLVNLSQLERVAKQWGKQGDQKASYTTIVETGDGGINALVTRELPTEMKSAEESLGVDSGTYNKIVDECIFGEQKPTDKVEGRIQPQPKQEWSKEDEMILSIIVDNLNFIRDTISHDAKYMVDVGSVEGQIEWLKSIQGRMSKLKASDE